MSTKVLLTAIVLLAAVGCRSGSPQSNPRPARPAATRPDSLPQAEPRQVVCQIVAEHFGAELPVVTPKTRLADLGADTLGIAEVVMDIEQKFKISIPKADVEAFQTVGQIIKCVQARLDERQGRPGD